MVSCGRTTGPQDDSDRDLQNQSFDMLPMSKHLTAITTLVSSFVIFVFEHSRLALLTARHRTHEALEHPWAWDLIQDLVRHMLIGYLQDYSQQLESGTSITPDWSSQLLK